MEVENEEKFLFLDALVYRKADGSLVQVYRKPTHTDVYLHAQSDLHPSQK